MLSSMNNEYIVHALQSVLYLYLIIDPSLAASELGIHLESVNQVQSVQVPSVSQDIQDK